MFVLGFIVVGRTRHTHTTIGMIMAKEMLWEWGNPK